jgi:predicted Fe-Mo cluster-binding NifX family protein
VAGIRVYTGLDGTVKEAIDRLKNGELEQAKCADIEGHWF